MRLDQFLGTGETSAHEALLLRRFIPDAERTQGEWRRVLDELRRSHLALNSLPAAPPPAVVPTKTFREVVIEALGSDFNVATIKTELIGYIDQKFNAFEYTAHRVAWRYDANNDYILDGINNTSINVVSLERFNQWSSSFTLPISRITGLQAALNDKAALQNGKHLISQYADGVFRREWTVADEAGLTALAGAFQGDVAQTQGGGRYALMGASPQMASNWFNLNTGSNVTSVNNKTGAVTLNAADVGALSVSTTPAQIGAAPISHTHTTSAITDINTWLPGRFVAGTGITITEDTTTRKLTLSVTASGLNVAWPDISGKPSTFDTTWNQVQGKPSSYPPTAHTHTRSQITDFVHAHPVGEITNFAVEAANAVGASIVSDTLTKTAIGNGQIRLEVGPTASGITFEEADGSPSLRATKLIVDGGELTQIDATTVKLRVAASGTGTGGTMAAYAPTYQRMLTAINPFPARTDLVIKAVVRTAFAQSDGRDFTVYTQAGAALPTNVQNVVAGVNYKDYYIAWTDTLNGSEQRTYTVKYGDAYAPERHTYSDALSRAISRPTQNAGTISVALDNSSGYKSPDFLIAPDANIQNANPQVFNAPSTLGGIQGSALNIVRTSGTVFDASDSASRIELIPTSGTVKPAFLLAYEYPSILSPAQATGGANGGPTQGGTCIVGRALPDGYALDFRMSGAGITIYQDLTIRYRAGMGWVWTLHHVEGQPSSARIEVSAGVRDAAGGNAVKFLGAGGVTSYSRPNRNDPSTWIAFTVDYIKQATATVGDETAITP